MYEGLKASEGERRRIRINSVLNSVGRRGPGWGNALGAMALMWSVFETIAYNARDTDDVLNPAGAGLVTGCIFRSTAVTLPADSNPTLHPREWLLSKCSRECGPTLAGFLKMSVRCLLTGAQDGRGDRTWAGSRVRCRRSSK